MIDRRRLLRALPSALLAASAPSLLAACGPGGMATGFSRGAARRAALLSPLSGRAATVGQSLAQAAALAVPEGDPALSFAAFDTGEGAGVAAAEALEDGADSLLGSALRV